MYIRSNRFLLNQKIILTIDAKTIKNDISSKVSIISVDYWAYYKQSINDSEYLNERL